MHYNNKGRSHSLLDRRSRLSLSLSVWSCTYTSSAQLGSKRVERAHARASTHTHTESRGRFFNGMVGDLP